DQQQGRRPVPPVLEVQIVALRLAARLGQSEVHPSAALEDGHDELREPVEPRRPAPGSRPRCTATLPPSVPAHRQAAPTASEVRPTGQLPLGSTSTRPFCALVSSPRQRGELWRVLASMSRGKGEAGLKAGFAAFLAG